MNLEVVESNIFSLTNQTDWISIGASIERFLEQFNCSELMREIEIFKKDNIHGKIDLIVEQRNSFQPCVFTGSCRSID